MQTHCHVRIEKSRRRREIPVFHLRRRPYRVGRRKLWRIGPRLPRHGAGLSFGGIRHRIAASAQVDPRGLAGTGSGAIPRRGARARVRRRRPSRSGGAPYRRGWHRRSARPRSACARGLRRCGGVPSNAGALAHSTFRHAHGRHGVWRRPRVRSQSRPTTVCPALTLPHFESADAPLAAGSGRARCGLRRAEPPLASPGHRAPVPRLAGNTARHR